MPEDVTKASTLTAEACEVHTRKDEPLTKTEYAELLNELDDAVWEVVNAHHLEGPHEFEEFRDALTGTDEVGELAEAE